jgi:uncharacterized protein (TIGR03083 family)
MATVIEVDTQAGFSKGHAKVPLALASLRDRFVTMLRGFPEDAWGRATRCEEWTVHDVVRHVRDVCAIDVARLRGEPSPFPIEGPFHPNVAPDQWLLHSTGESPADTVADLDRLAGEERAALAERIARGGDDLDLGPYGPIHWTVLGAHIYWDAWVHERDIAEPLGLGHLATADEDALAACYGFVAASIPSVMSARPLDVSVALTAPGGRAYTVAVAPGRVTLADARPDDRADLHGELVPVTDALTGRGAEVRDVLTGPETALEPLTWLRRFMTTTP